MKLERLEVHADNFGNSKRHPDDFLKKLFKYVAVLNKALLPCEALAGLQAALSVL